MRLTSYKCEFCTHQVGPRQQLPPECTECRCGNHFQIKTKMHPMDAKAWDKHQRLDRFIDEAVKIPVVLWQRELLHKCLDEKPIYYRGCGRSTERAVIDVFLQIFEDSEKEKNHEENLKEKKV